MANLISFSDLLDAVIDAQYDIKASAARDMVTVIDRVITRAEANRPTDQNKMSLTPDVAPLLVKHDTVQAALNEGKVIGAIQAFRTLTGCTLAYAREAVNAEAVVKGIKPEDKPEPQRNDRVRAFGEGLPIDGVIGKIARIDKERDPDLDGFEVPHPYRIYADNGQRVWARDVEVLAEPEPF